MSELQLFKRVIDAWRRRSNRSEHLTLNQIANIAFGHGSSENAAKVGRMIAEFRRYFVQASPYSRKFGVNWPLVQRDFADRFKGAGTGDPGSEPSRATSGESPSPIRGPAVKASPVDLMQGALDDEIRALRLELEQRPLRALGAAPLADSSEESYLYEAVVDLPGDAELPIPEGVGVNLCWRTSVDPPVVKATLLAFDPIESRVVLEIDRPLSRRHLGSDFSIFPRVEELLVAVKGALDKLRDDPSSLAWRLLQGGSPREIRPPEHGVQPPGVDRSQLEAITRCLTHDVTFLWGPPGTGKTHTLGRLIALLAVAGQRILAVSIANVAVDQLALRVVEGLEALGTSGRALLAEGRIVRFGHPRLPEVVRESRLFPSRERTQQLRCALEQLLREYRETPERDLKRRALIQKKINDTRDELRQVTRETLAQAAVILTTAVQACMDPLLSEQRFDTLVVDEASMMPIPHAIAVASVAKQRLVVAGDFRQLGPIALSRSQAAFDWLHRDLFALVGIAGTDPSHAALAMLTVQRRMHREICDLINRCFYGGRLQTNVTTERTRACGLPPLPGKAAVLVSLTPEDGSSVEQTEAGSRLNRSSAQLAVSLAGSLLQQEPTIRIGIVTPYRAQVTRIKRLIREGIPRADLASRVHVGTVHAFQGAESDVIIWDIVDTRAHPIGRLYRGDTGNRLVNVAITRAQGKLLVIGDPRVFFEAPQAEAVHQARVLFTAFQWRNGNMIRARDLAI